MCRASAYVIINSVQSLAGAYSPAQTGKAPHTESSCVQARVEPEPSPELFLGPNPYPDCKPTLILGLRGRGTWSISSHMDSRKFSSSAVVQRCSSRTVSDCDSHRACGPGQNGVCRMDPGDLIISYTIQFENNDMHCQRQNSLSRCSKLLNNKLRACGSGQKGGGLPSAAGSAAGAIASADAGG